MKLNLLTLQKNIRLQKLNKKKDVNFVIKSVVDCELTKLDMLPPPKPPSPPSLLCNNTETTKEIAIIMCKVNNITAIKFI